MKLADPWLLALLALVIPCIWVYRRRKRPVVRFPSSIPLKALHRSKATWLRHVPFVLRMATVALVVIAMARPQDDEAKGQKTSEGIDIVLIIDTSRSMEARDFALGASRPNRLEVVKAVISDFIRGRPSDRIGVVVFGTEAFTQAPLTLDHELLQRFLARVQIGMAGDATAIGDGVATATMRLKDLTAKSKVAILLTDGGNTAGRVDPLAAAQAAKSLGVHVYAIGVGSDAEVPVDVNGQVQVQKTDVDFELLKQIAKTTDAQWYQANDTETLQKVYETIDRLEKTKIKIESFEHHEERFGTFAWLALGCMLAELGLGLTRIRSVP